MSDINIRVSGRTGRITLARPKALNAVTWDMVHKIRDALPLWAENPDIDMVIIDAEGEKAFCAGGDIADIYQALVDGNPDIPRQFWREEYALNAALFNFPKPVAAFLQGYTMGGGVGIGCHASHRIVCETSKIAMPECSIGLVPDVGGSLILARAPGRLGEYLGTTAYRMGPGDAIEAGFADYYIGRDMWPALIATLEASGDWTEVDRAAGHPPESPLANIRPQIDANFGGETLRDILATLNADASEWAADTTKRLARNAPLAVASAVELIHRARVRDRIEDALAAEYRFAHRIAEQDDFREGIRAAIIDRDETPKWQHATLDAPSPAQVAQMLMPLGADELDLTH